jgi:C4-dicarboxylate-specific signal transduction histidine kinase
VTLMALRQMACVPLFAPLVFVGLILLVLCQAPPAFSVAPSAPAGQRPHRILLLEGLTPTQPAVIQTLQGFKRRLQQKGAGNIEVAVEFLDLGRFHGLDDENRLVRFLSERLVQERPDLIVSISRGATSFLARHRAEIARGVPVMFCCTSMPASAPLDLPSDMPGVLLVYDWVGTLALAERLQPNATTLVLVSGTGNVASNWERDAIQRLQPYLKKYNIRHVVSSRRDELLKGVSDLPRDAIVILVPIFSENVDSTGFPAEIAADIAKASSAPAYSPVATLFGGGIVGGSMESYVAQGSKAADLALDMLSGKDLSSIPRLTKLPLQYRVDARELARWRLSDAALPPGTVMEFREPTFWEKYRDWAIGLVLAFAAQAAIIALLLIQKRKRRTVEQLLKESEDRMAFAAASSNIGIWRLESDSGLLWATDHCRAMFGIAPGAPLAWERFRQSVHPEDREIFDESVRAPVRLGLPVASEFRVVRPGNHVSWFICRGHAVCDDHGRPRHLTGIFIDVTARKIAEAEAELQRTELNHIIRVAALGELSNGLARELSQPLTAIVANAAAAQSIAKQDRQEVAQVLKEIVEDSERAGQVVHRLRTLLKRDERRSGCVDLNSVVLSTLSLLRPQFVSRRIKPHTDLPKDPPQVLGDWSQLQQVFVSLMTNAMESMESTPAVARKLIVRSRLEPGGYVEIAISDSGRGLTPHESQNLFRPFFTTKERGLGLGLWICSTIVASHGGRLKVINAPGGGATAIVSLPVAVEKDEHGIVAAQLA